MAYRVVSAPEARAQLAIALHSHAGKASAEVAFAFTTSIVDHCETFITFRQRGAGRDDLRAGLAHDRFSQTRSHRFLCRERHHYHRRHFMAGITLTRALRGGVDKEGSVS
jgi:plasmid stabilization system protein ParE